MLLLWQAGRLAKTLKQTPGSGGRCVLYFGHCALRGLPHLVLCGPDQAMLTSSCLLKSYVHCHLPRMTFALVFTGTQLTQKVISSRTLTPAPDGPYPPPTLQGLSPCSIAYVGNVMSVHQEAASSPQPWSNKRRRNSNTCL